MSWLLMMLVGAATAGPCEDAGDGFVIGPVSASLGSGGAGTPHRTCARSEFGVAAGGDLTADTANFYGYIAGGLTLDGAYAVRPDVEVTARLEAVRLDLGIASLTATTIGLGHLTLGAGWGHDLSDQAALGVRGNLVLPTATPLYQNGHPFTAEFQVTSVQTPHPMVRVHEGLGGRFRGTAGGPVDPKGGLMAFAGVEVRPVPQFGIVVDVDTSLFFLDVLDHFAVAGALRFGDGKRFGFELGGRAPLLGADRSLAAIELRGVVRLGPIAPRVGG